MVKEERQKRLKVFRRRSEGNGPQKGIEMLVTFAVEHKNEGIGGMLYMYTLVELQICSKTKNSRIGQMQP